MQSSRQTARYATEPFDRSGKSAAFFQHSKILHRLVVPDPAARSSWVQRGTPAPTHSRASHCGRTDAPSIILKSVRNSPANAA
jgi:hypothetical protein